MPRWRQDTADLTMYGPRSLDEFPPERAVNATTAQLSSGSDPAALINSRAACGHRATTLRTAPLALSASNHAGSCETLMRAAQGTASVPANDLISVRTVTWNTD